MLIGAMLIKKTCILKTMVTFISDITCRNRKSLFTVEDIRISFLTERYIMKIWKFKVPLRGYIK